MTKVLKKKPAKKSVKRVKNVEVKQESLPPQFDQEMAGRMAIQMVEDRKALQAAHDRLASAEEAFKLVDATLGRCVVKIAGFLSSNLGVERPLLQDLVSGDSDVQDLKLPHVDSACVARLLVSVLLEMNELA